MQFAQVQLVILNSKKLHFSWNLCVGFCCMANLMRVLSRVFVAWCAASFHIILLLKYSQEFPHDLP